MRTSDDERRRAAAELREAAGALESGDQLSDGAIVDVVHDACMDGGALDRCAGDLCGMDREFFLRLADLIEPEERTCMLAPTQLTHHGPYGNTYHTCRIVCSECRHDMPEHGESINYCPHCGAKVVE